MPPKRYILTKAFLFIMLFTVSVLFFRDTVVGGKINPLQGLLLIVFCILLAYGIAKIVFRLLYFFVFKRIENFNASLPELSDEEKEKIRKLRLKIIAFKTLLLAAIPLLFGEFADNNAISILAFIVALPFVFLLVFLHYYIFVVFPANYIRRVIKRQQQKKNSDMR